MMDVPTANTQEALQRIRKVSRPEAIADLRERLRGLETPEECVCAAVGQLGIFCKGFRRLDEAALVQRFDWIARQRPSAPRQALETLASLYHLGRQEATGAEICCDVETREHTACDGWNGFENGDLERFHLALTGEPIQIR